MAAGIVATAPLVIALRWGLTTGWPPAVRFLRLIHEKIAPLFAGAGAGTLALAALAAGVAEEALFRGVIQEALAARVPIAVAIGLTALLFGLVHWVSAAYAALACLAAAYLGVLYLTTGNLLVPIVAHALYDFVALLALVRMKPDSAALVRETGPE